MATVSILADTSDSGDRRSGKATDALGGVPGDFNCYQQNVSALMGSGGGFGFGCSWENANPSTPLTNGNYLSPPSVIAFSFFTPDIAFPGVGSANFYIPGAVGTASSFSVAHEVIVTGSCVVSPPSGNSPPFPTNIVGALGLVSGANITLIYSRLLPKGNYNALLLTTWGSNITGFSGSVYWSTPNGDNLITNVDDAGGYSAGSPHQFSITEPWAYIKISLNSIQANSTSIYEVTMILDPTVVTQPISHTVTHPASTTFPITANGAAALSYQWQFSAGGIIWSNLTNTGVYTGVTTSTLSISNSTGLNGAFYRCNVTDSSGTVASNPGILTVI